MRKLRLRKVKWLTDSYTVRKASGICIVWLEKKGIKDSKKKCKIIENRVEAIKFAIATARKNDIIVLAGKGHETYQILSTGKIHLDEREIVKESLEQ